MKVFISQRAEEDLARIYATIVHDRPLVAEVFKAAANESLAVLGRHPEIGPRVGFRTRHKGLRFWPVSGYHNYLIYYLLGEAHVSIERILDGRRDVRRVLRTGEV